MDVFDAELLSLWAALNRNSVAYIMVGGVATNLHGYQRSTEDIDIWIKDTVENRKGIRKAFAECEMGDFEPLERMPFIPGWTYFHLNNGVRLDLMTNMKSPSGELSFDECYHLASIAQINDVSVPFLHINHLLQNKKAVARLKDQLDVQELEKIKKLQEEEGLDGPKS
ncbi:hypothetical protein [Paracnuella aquatica]|uniref:hypothetical protein n=1 Tax=Paracnuella aquatica TaxID=2268757 RepID=UPI000DEEC5F1|nr:hypothetical protein [Paracnuella aquatica]RPD48215.1 hypothetical protein DRJ53_10735 [Paracnuella aquatica]